MSLSRSETPSARTAIGESVRVHPICACPGMVAMTSDATRKALVRNCMPGLWQSERLAALPIRYRRRRIIRDCWSRFERIFHICAKAGEGIEARVVSLYQNLRKPVRRDLVGRSRVVAVTRAAIGKLGIKRPGLALQRPSYRN